MAMPRLAIRLHSAMQARRSAELARCAEDNGFSTVWFAENPYQRGVLPAMSASALATETIELGIGVFNPFNRHPTLMAMEIGAFDELSCGRAILGIGSGVPAWIEKITPYESVLNAVRDAVHIARGLLSGQKVDYRGKVFSAEKVHLEFPLWRERVPIHIAAMGEKMLRLCGELGDGLLIGNMCPPSFTETAIKRMEEGAARVGRCRPSEITKYVPCSVGTDDLAVKKVARNAIGHTLGTFWKAYASSNAAIAAIRNDNGIDPEVFDCVLERLAAGETGAEALDDTFIRAYGVVGSVDDCIEQIETIGDSGITQLTLTILGEAPEDAIRMLGAATRT